MVSGQIDPPRYKELLGRQRSIQPGQYVVYQFVAKSSARCTPDGTMLSSSSEMGYVFDNLIDAKDYCRWKVGESPKLGCTVYGSSKAIADQFFDGRENARTGTA